MLKKVSLILIILIIIISIFIFSFKEETVKLKTFGSLRYDSARDIVEYKNNFFLTGLSIKDISRYVDVFLMKVDNNGRKIFMKYFGGREDDRAFSIIRDDKNFLITGYTTSFSSNKHKDIYLLKTDLKGNLIWQKNFGGYLDEEGFQTIITKDNNYLTIGNSNSYNKNSDSDIFLIKVDKDGKFIWGKLYGGNNMDNGVSVLNCENGYLLCGTTKSFGKGLEDIILIKVDENGNYLWSRTYGSDRIDRAVKVIPAIDGNGYLILSERVNSDEPDKLTDISIIRISKNGDIIWEKYYGGSQMENAKDIKYSIDNDGYVVIGDTFSYGKGDFDIYLISIDKNGNEIFSKTYGGIKDDYAGGITTYKNYYVICGWTLSFGAGDYDILFLKTNKNGEF